MFYVVGVLIVLTGLFLVTPRGARLAVDWRRIDGRGRPAREAAGRPDLVRINRLAGAGMIVGAVAIMLIYTL